MMEALLHDMPPMVMAITVLTMIAAVLVHFETFSFLTTLLQRLQLASRLKMIVLMFSILFLHLIEIWLFAFAYVAICANHKYGQILGHFKDHFLDYVYYSAVTYTSLGFGDLIPLGPVRFLTAMEALTGLTLIGWSASFMFIEMREFWKRD